MKRFALVFSFLAVSILLSETALHAQRGRGAAAGGGGVGRGAAPAPQAPANRGNSANAGAPNNAPAKSDAPKAASTTKKPENKVADDIHLNPKLEDRVKGMLPPNTSMADASAGFKNRGQFIAALHVAKNLNIPFGDLRSRMTGNQAMPLGKAIENLKPELGKAKANDEAKRAEREAKDTEKGSKA